MINNSSIQKWHRLQQKNLDNQFIQKIISGCNCSSFEAKAILETVNEVYSPYFNNSSTLKPGQLQIPVVSCNVHPNTPLAEAEMVNVSITLFDDSSDLEIRKNNGIIALRQHRIQRICIEVFQQGGLLTVEDIAFRILNCGARTVCRDLDHFRSQGISLPLRSTIKDMGRTLSHRKLIVEKWLLGEEYQAIAKNSFHSIPSVRNYVEKFKRVHVLTLQKYDEHTISFLVKISSTLVKQYQNLSETLDIIEHRKQELISLSKKKPS